MLDEIVVALLEEVPGPFWKELQGRFVELRPILMPAYRVKLTQPGVHELSQLLTQADVLVVGGAGNTRLLNAEVLGGAPRLRYIHKYGIRTHKVDFAAVRHRGIPIVVEAMENHIGVAEQAFALLLTLAKQVLPAHGSIVEGAYRHHQLEPRPTTASFFVPNWSQIRGLQRLYRKTMGLIGFGNIAAELARRASAFGMRVVYYSRSRLSPEEEAFYHATFRSLDELLSESDVVSLHMPQSLETEKMIGFRELRLMKRTAFLINTARGSVVDEDALADALSQGIIAGAGLDVFAMEPLPTDHPLVNAPNVVLSPHVGIGPRPIPDRFDLLIGNVAKVAGGGAPEGAVV